MPDSLSMSLDQAQVADLYRRLGAAAATKTLVPPITRGTARLRSVLATYPPQQTGRRQPPKTPRQRRFLMALAKAGGIPYKRTGNLGRAWVEEVTTSLTGVTGTIGNAVTGPSGTHYGPFVQGSATQTAFFRGSSWTTDQAALDQCKAEIERDCLGAIRAALG